MAWEGDRVGVVQHSKTRGDHMRRVLAMMSVLALGAAVPLQNEAAADGGP